MIAAARELAKKAAATKPQNDGYLTGDNWGSSERSDEDVESLEDEDEGESNEMAEGGEGGVGEEAEVVS
ncbi:hypothetical protein HBI56_122730 [Parastagonospora nodorum]|uniref:Uncharacterized protein n=2 Tax=Phaeosphaeria nodorum (strain SN15 / ATCC MYA-4574 / FGSC 10173) TaxID=321614 RepID=A0A7U2FDB1_PHANO|nr:hypothetical protein SNOG_05117 [Parastagonospora nodorum SN15]KAH3917068.1 hypothetical protein HBH56_051950 [Parastagonospora nodorum]EAT87508.2 hypothetical protein SNOG_05117 [Parastagonospora nodorum SN15]KAH3935462.1 hypothetical protein HBH54_037740 [Parastagonospora nodorum]KAH3948793.1 hypothetical protein HBH53_101420 [Parastagonospora nodorum]KAH3969940.1 hypothetical protein HBH51_117710 [Parastagonospora nodorum]